MALAPEWMETPSSQGKRITLGKERERGAPPKYGKQHSFHFSYLSPSHSSFVLIDTVERKPKSPFSCSQASSPPPAPTSLLGEVNPRVLNRSKSSPGFGSSKSNKSKKGSDRPSFVFAKPIKPKPTKPAILPSYGKSHSQPNLFNSDKTANWHQQKSQQPSSAFSSTAPAVPSPLVNSTTTPSPPPPPAPVVTPTTASQSPSPPLPPSPSPPLAPDGLDKLRQLVPSTSMPPKSVRPRALVGPPPPPTAKKPAAAALLTPPTPAGSPASQHKNPASYFRKATSEPSLQLLKQRNNFFQHVIKQAEKGIQEDDSPIGQDQPIAPSASTSIPTSTTPYTSTSTTVESTAEPSESLSTSPRATTPPTSSPPTGLRSPLPENKEAEEEFMRKLGWVPEEEETVPVLGEDEIADVRVKICLSKKRRETSPIVQKELSSLRHAGIGVGGIE